MAILLLLLATQDPGARARALQANGRGEEAVAAWLDVLALPAPPDPGAAWSLRSSQGEARWELAFLRMSLGRYREALLDLREGALKQPRMILCGNGKEGMDLLRLERIAVCLEHLGRWTEAVELQFRARGPSTAGLHLRVVDLYDAAGQRDDLLRRLDAEGILPCQAVFRRIFDLRREAESGRFEGLVDILMNAQNHGWERDECLRLIRLHPAETFPVLSARLPAFPASEVLLVPLAELRTVEAAEALEMAAVRTNQDRFASGLLAVLRTMGPSAAEPLDRLPWRGSWYTRQILKSPDRIRLPRRPDLPFPEFRRADIPPDFRAPS